MFPRRSLSPCFPASPLFCCYFGRVIFTFKGTLRGASRNCYHCRVRERCFDTTALQLKRCAPTVDHCVKKLTVSRVTGVVVTERYCGGRDFLDTAKKRGLVEDRCYVEEEEVVVVEGRDRRTASTVCFCSTDMCNGQSTSHSLPAPPPSAPWIDTT
ncbi:hypothetical protein GWK47_047798 [Chionoecetes opilio]|uniref:Uncharacterized protein n=1 Tax=Chionoecetes opilio TaxID=41210 RepID=A0A8J4Y543_CHIOP|nr:hypothetical protein GWK47_047798 [Chionoecetes opilio]